MVARDDSRLVNAEQRLKELGISLPAPPEPFGVYVEAVQSGNLLFLTGMLPTEFQVAKFIGRVGAELDVETGSKSQAEPKSKQRCERSFDGPVKIPNVTG
jgi:hypothetical protein